MIVKIEDVHKTYRKATVLRGVAMEFGPGVTCLLGKNGAGKSTLVRQIVGIERPSAGTIDLVLDGETLGGRARYAATGWLPQSFGHPVGMSVKDFVAYAAWLKELPSGQASRRISDVLDVVGLHDSARKKLGELSGGMLRRAGLAAAIVHRPQCLILDEPTAGLDPVQRAEFHRRVLALSESTTILLATHLLEDVAAVGANVSVINDGTAVWRGSTDDLAAVGGGRSASVDSLRRGLIDLVGAESP